MTSRRLAQEQAADAEAAVGTERALRERIRALQERDERLAAAEAMLQEQEALPGGGAAAAQEGRGAPAGEAAPAAQQPEQGAAPRLKLPRLGDALPDFAGGEWTAALVRQRRVSLQQRLKQTREALAALAPAAAREPRAAGRQPVAA